MPPTIQIGTAQPEKRLVKPGEKKSELVRRVEYCNTLPDISFDLKFISYPSFYTIIPHLWKETNKDVYVIKAGVLIDPADKKTS